MKLPERVKSNRQKAKASIFQIYLCGLPPECMVHILGGSSSTSNDSVKKTHYRRAQLPGFSLIPEALKLTSRLAISEFPRAGDTEAWF